MEYQSPAQLIAQALDTAMQNFNGGRGISQSDLARRSGVPQPTISRTLKGKTIPETETISKLISVLGEENVKLDRAVYGAVDICAINGTTTTIVEVKQIVPAYQTRIDKLVEKIRALPPKSPMIDAIEAMLLTTEPVRSNKKQIIEDDSEVSFDTIRNKIHRNVKNSKTAT